MPGILKFDRARRTRSRAEPGGINLALSLLSHRKFCPDCKGTARLVEQALLGASIRELITQDQAQTGDLTADSANG